MDFFEVIQQRRSIRKYTTDAVPADVIQKALDAALLAPNSSNTQTWDFYWVKTPAKKEQLRKACLNQSAARTASDLVVVTANPKKWKRSQPYLIDYIEKAQAPKQVIVYYKKLIPLIYKTGLYSLIRALAFFFGGLFKPGPRYPITFRDLQEISVKSAALACENFVLAITAQGYSSCMMEGFDEKFVKKILQLKCSDKVVMVISVGKELEDGKGTWGPRYRIPSELVVHEV